MRPSCVRLGASWLSIFLSVVQVDPRLNIIAISEPFFLLRLRELLARLVPPATLPEKRIPDGNFLFAGSSPTREAPVEDFLVRTALERSLHEFVVIYAEKSRATGIEVGWILDTGKIVWRQLTSGF